MIYSSCLLLSMASRQHLMIFSKSCLLMVCRNFFFSYFSCKCLSFLWRYNISRSSLCINNINQKLRKIKKRILLKIYNMSRVFLSLQWGLDHMVISLNVNGIWFRSIQWKMTIFERIFNNIFKNLNYWTKE